MINILLSELSLSVLENLDLACMYKPHRCVRSVLTTWVKILPEEVGHAPNCLMVEAINQSGACISLGVNLEELVARRMKRISLRIFSTLTSLVI